jgi:hypothetical protein
MEIMSLGGLLFAGDCMNKRNNKKQLDKKRKRVEEKKKETDLYNNNQVPTNINEINAIAEKRFKESQDPEKTGVIPRFYTLMKNTPKKLRTNVEDDIDNQYLRKKEHFGSTPSSPTSFMGTENRLRNNEHFEGQIMNQPSEFLNQFNEMTFNNPGLPSAMGEGIGTDINSPSMRQGIEDEIVRRNNINSVPVFRGDDLVIPRQEVENNFQPMQPMFRKGGKLRMQHGGFVNQRINELFTGDMYRDDWQPKKETTPFFSPIIGMTNTNGMPVMTDFFEERYVPSKERRNEKPFQPTKVNTGLNLGYNEIGQDGYQDKFRYLPKTVNEMRTLGDHQKTTFGVPVVPGLKGQRGPIIGKTIKKLPDRFKSNNLGDIMLGLSSDTKAPKTREFYEVENLATKNRGVKMTPNMGPAQYMVTRNTPDYIREKYRKTAKQNFLQDPPTNVHLVEGLSSIPMNLEAFIPNMTQRAVKDENKYIGPAGTSMIGGNYVIKYFNEVPDVNRREIHNRYDRAGNAVTGNMIKTPATDFNDVHDITKREIHNKYDRVGNAIVGNMGKQPAEDFNDVHDITKRELINKYDRAGNAVTGNMGKQPAEDFEDVHDLTKREVCNGPMIGPANHDTKQGYVIKYVDWVPDMTAREMFNGELIGPANHDTKQGYVLKYVDWTPDMTEREMHAKNNYIGPYRDYVGGSRSRADAEHMLLNTSKEYVQQSRVPNMGGYNKGYTNMFTGHEFKADCEFPRRIGPNAMPLTTDHIKYTETRVPNYKWYVNRRINSLALDNLEGNQYINNVVSKAVRNKS